MAFSFPSLFPISISDEEEEEELITPDRKKWYEYSKQDCNVLCFPVFTEDEIQSMCKSCFPKLANEKAEAEVKERYDKWGGIPRLVLHKIDSADQNRLQQTLENQSVLDLVHRLRFEGLEVDVSHRFLHLKTRAEVAGVSDSELTPLDSQYYEYHLTAIASMYVMRHLYTQIKDTFKANLRLALQAETHPPANIAHLYGTIFEEDARFILSKGGTFPMRKLQKNGNGDETNLVLPATSFFPYRGFESLQELKATCDSGTFLYPRSKSFCAVDFILAGKMPANATINLEHGLKWTNSSGDSDTGLSAVVKALELPMPPAISSLAANSPSNQSSLSIQSSASSSIQSSLSNSSPCGTNLPAISSTSPSQ